VGPGRGLYNGGPFTLFCITGREDVQAITGIPRLPEAPTGEARGRSELGYIFVNTKDAPALAVRMEKNPKYTPDNAGRAGAVVSDRGPRGMGGFRRGGPRSEWTVARHSRCFKPPWGRLIAVNAASEVAWEAPLRGITEIRPRETSTPGSPIRPAQSRPRAGWVFHRITSG